MTRLALALSALALSTPAWAICAIHNDTDESFMIQSGNVSNQRVGSHTITSINHGAIVAKADSGKSVSGSCNNGDKIEIVLQGGVLVIRPQ